MDEAEKPIPIECFEARNLFTCKNCGESAYWICVGHKGKRPIWRAYNIQTRLPHPDCFKQSKLRIYRYRD